MNNITLKYKIFEGEEFRKLLKKKNRANTLYYKKLNLNRTWLSDLIPDYSHENNFSLPEKIKNFLD